MLCFGAISPGLAAQKNVSENYYAVKQLIAVGLGVIAFIITATLPIKTWRHIQIPLVNAGIAAVEVALLVLIIRYALKRPTLQK